MRILLLVLVLSSLVGCVADSDSNKNSRALPDPVQTQNFKDLTSVKWCQTPEGNDHVYMTSWAFNSDNTVKWVITDVANNKVQHEVVASWKIEKNVLKVAEQTSGTEILSKQFSIKYDMSSQKKIMTWIPVQVSSCGASGDCSQHSINPGDTTVLTECN